MNPNNRSLWIDLTAARYLDAIERDDFDAQLELWRAAEVDPELEAAFHDLHAGLIAEQGEAATAAVASAAENHLRSGDVVRSTDGPVTVADVANELFRDTPGRLSAEVHAMNERLRSATESLPTDLGMWSLREWIEAKFGSVPPEYVKAFRQAALKVRMRANSETGHQLAARRVQSPTGDTK